MTQVRPLALVALVVGLSGCTLIFPPDDARLARLSVDAGVDGGTDSSSDGGRDGGTDGGTDSGAPNFPDAGPQPKPPEAVCDDGLDDDENGLVDCADFACRGRDVCCDTGETILSTQWTSPDLGTRWDPLRSGDPLPAVVSVEGAFLLAGWDDAVPSGVRLRSCAPLATGADFTFTLARTPSACTTCRAGLVLSAATDAGAAAGLFDDLAITWATDGLFRVTQAGLVLAETTFFAETALKVSLALEPVTDAGRARLAATVRAGPSTEAARIVLPDTPVLDLDQLRRDASGDCAATPGLSLAFEGLGEGIAIGTVSASTRSCANPSHFGAGGDTGWTWPDSALDLPPQTTSGSFGRPGIAVSRDESDIRWDIVLEGSNLDPSLERFGHVGYAIVHTRAVTDLAAPDTWSSAPEPRLGESIPACFGAGCPTDPPPSVRDPSLMPERAGDETLARLVLTYARESEAEISAGRRDRFELWILSSLPLRPDAPLTGAGRRLLSLDDVGECRSLRDPTLIPTVDESFAPLYWLFFTCEPFEGAPRIMAAPLDSSFTRIPGTEAQVVLEASASGVPGALSVSSPEPIVAFGDPSTLVELFFVVTLPSGEDAIGRAALEVVTDGFSLDRALDPFEAYRANPVLRGDDAALGTCDGTCSLRSVAAARQLDDPSLIRLFVSRETRSGGASRFDLVAVDQRWEAPE